MKTSEPPIVVQHVFDVPVYRVWNALTLPEEMRQWFFPNIPEYEAKVGFETQFTVENDGRTFPHLWKVLEVAHLRKMVQEWRYEGYAGCCTVSYTLEAIKELTRLTVTVTVLEDFPDNIPEFKRESGVSGWEYFILQNLKKYLEG